MARVGISLGSNLGDRIANISEAILGLGEAQCSQHLLVSSLYQTAPVGCPSESPDFYNCAVEIETSLQPLTLLDLTQAIERGLGRPEIRGRNAPRTVDLDLLYYNNLETENERLVLPHPRMAERAFVILPLLEIRPDLRSQFDQSKISNQNAKKLPLSDWKKYT